MNTSTPIAKPLKLRIPVRQSTRGTYWSVTSPSENFHLSSTVNKIDMRGCDGLFDLASHWEKKGWLHLAGRLRNSLNNCIAA